MKTLTIGYAGTRSCRMTRLKSLPRLTCRALRPLTTGERHGDSQRELYVGGGVHLLNKVDGLSFMLQEKPAFHDLYENG